MKNLTSVVDLLKNIGIEKETINRVEDYIKNRSISQKLSILRAKSNLTVEELSEKAKISKKYIDKMEESSNDKISVGELIKYAEILGYKVSISFSKVKEDAKV